MPIPTYSRVSVFMNFRIFLCFLTFIHLSESLCTSQIFCHGDLLHSVQMARIFPDSKTFVDLKMKHNEQKTLQNFNVLLQAHKKPNRRQIKDFVLQNFERRKEFESWIPPDFTSTPKFLQRISNEEVRNFGQNLVNIWPKLARKIKPEVLNSSHLYTVLPVNNGFVVPGGRFEEFYYWDSYWIIEGLLLCEMYDTVRGMLENFIQLVQNYGFVPNGSRIYYLDRTQPPLLSLMVAAYIDATNDTQWLSKNVDFLEQELYFFLNNRITDVYKNGSRYRLAHYSSSDGTPRPESYYEDVQTASILKNEKEKEKLYANLKSAAESGWDFSSRWIVDNHGTTNGNLTFIQTKRIVPVDLNAFLCQAFRKLSEFFVILHNHDRAMFWMDQTDLWLRNIHKVFYHEEDGIWYDWDKVLERPRKFFYPSNFAPLWAGAYNLAKSEEIGQKAANYLVNSGVMEFDGGIPTSLVQSGEQWDYPNAWPPLQAIVIFGLDQTGCVNAKKVAKNLAEKWIASNLVSFYKTNQMFEKYSAQYSGESGNGGEYKVQSGFGWTNGVLFQLINRYYTHTKKKS